MTEYLARLQKNYRMALGRQLCEKFKMQPGDVLQLKETPIGILVVPVKLTPKLPSEKSDSYS